MKLDAGGGSSTSAGTTVGGIERRGQDPAVQAAVYGLGPRHIAVALGLKPPAARKRLERARRWIKTELTRYSAPA